MRYETIFNRAKDHGCDACRQRDLQTFYMVHLHFLPTKLVRKRHKDRERLAFYCQPCFENMDNFPYKFNGQEHRVPSQGKSDFGCTRCPSEITTEKLYGMIDYSKWIDESIVDQMPLVLFCAECAEKGIISLTRQLATT